MFLSIILRQLFLFQPPTKSGPTYGDFKDKNNDYGKKKDLEDTYEGNYEEGNYTKEDDYEYENLTEQDDSRFQHKEHKIDMPKKHYYGGKN